MPRAIVLALLSIFVLSAQHEGFRHAYDHLRAKIQRGPEAALESSSAGICTECALLAAASSAAPADARAAAHVVAAASLVATKDVLSAAVAPPAYYRSRAPPAVA
jgi:hypothetical protein